jgi:SprT protein
MLFCDYPARSSKLGDYRPPQRGLPHRISVNHNLNQHEFLITLIHEMAHLLCWENMEAG